jgi:hypothetical protein
MGEAQTMKNKYAFNKLILKLYSGEVWLKW